MAKENYNKEFLKYIDNGKEYDSFVDIDESNIKLKNIDNVCFENQILSKKDLTGCSFNKCKFVNVSFFNISSEYLFFKFCDFTKCVFEDVFIQDAEFENSFFYSVNFNGFLLSETFIANSSFENVEFFRGEIDSCILQNVVIDMSYLNATYFEYSGYATKLAGDDSYDLKVKNSEIIYSHFKDYNLANTTFNDVEMRSVSFIDCNINNRTFANNVRIFGSGQLLYIDIQSILKSDIDKATLKLFGIHNESAKEYIQDLATEVKYQSIFISYSFKDKIFAQALSHEFMSRGVKSFFWERDAPGGKRLKHIMYENVNNHDRLLFIASEHSLKSEACHYELQEAREKQDKEWRDIYFPIHIDNYLFELRKDDIPRKHRDVFWENIEEVKEFHSKDFSAFKTEEDFKSPEFEEAVKQLIKDLKL